VVRPPEVLGGVLVLGGVAAADVPTAEAETKMDPIAPDLETVLAPSRAGRDVADVLHVRARRYGVGPSR
jgi:hypothetical protein